MWQTGLWSLWLSVHNTNPLLSVSWVSMQTSTSALCLQRHWLGLQLVPPFASHAFAAHARHWLLPGTLTNCPGNDQTCAASVQSFSRSVANLRMPSAHERVHSTVGCISCRYAPACVHRGDMWYWICVSCHSTAAWNSSGCHRLFICHTIPHTLCDGRQRSATLCGMLWRLVSVVWQQQPALPAGAD